MTLEDQMQYRVFCEALSDQELIKLFRQERDRALTGNLLYLERWKIIRSICNSRNLL